MPAAGAGSRFGAGRPKQYAALAGRTVIEWALAPFLADPRCVQIVVALSSEDTAWTQLAGRLEAGAGDPQNQPRLTRAAGGARRSDSVRNALRTLEGRAGPADWVLVHDAARPCLDRRDLERLVTALAAHPVGGLLAVPAADTFKRARAAARGESSAEVAETVERSALWRALTPQMFRYAPLCAALDAAHAAGRFPSDEAQALEWAGEHPQLIEGAASNLKITTGEDLELAAAVLRAHRAAGAAAAPERA